MFIFKEIARKVIEQLFEVVRKKSEQVPLFGIGLDKHFIIFMLKFRLKMLIDISLNNQLVITEEFSSLLEVVMNLNDNH